MNSQGIARVVLGGLVGVTLMAGSVRAQHPTSFAENASQYNAYVYGYHCKVMANGLADTITSGIDGEVALMISDFCDEAFLHCYDALMNDDDSLWAEALEDYQAARLWCETLVVFVGDSQSTAVTSQIDSLMWYLDIAIDNAAAARPATKGFSLPSFPRKRR